MRVNIVALLLILIALSKIKSRVINWEWWRRRYWGRIENKKQSRNYSSRRMKEWMKQQNTVECRQHHSPTWGSWSWFLREKNQSEFFFTHVQHHGCCRRCEFNQSWSFACECGVTKRNAVSWILKLVWQVVLTNVCISDLLGAFWYWYSWKLKRHFPEARGSKFQMQIRI